MVPKLSSGIFSDLIVSFLMVSSFDFDFFPEMEDVDLVTESESKVVFWGIIHDLRKSLKDTHVDIVLVRYKKGLSLSEILKLCPIGG